MDKRKIGGFALLAVLASIVFVGLLKRYQFKRNYKFAAGTVTEITLPGWKSSGNYSILYQYVIDGKVYRNNSNRNYCNAASMSNLQLLLKGKKFPVAYSAKDNSVSSILLTQSDANIFQYVLPDSMKVFESKLDCR